jgi:beta-lactamase superfamily II metal-dependent hydrolase
MEQLASDFDVKQIILPDYYPSKKIYGNMMAAIINAGIPISRMAVDSESLNMTIGDLQLSFIPSTLEYDNQDKSDNGQSLICSVSFGVARLLFTGDAEGKWLSALCYGSYNLTCNFLKLPHHGVWDDSLTSLMIFTMPEFAVVTDSQKSPADTRTEELLATFETTAFYTRNGEYRFNVHRDGNIELVVDKQD